MERRFRNALHLLVESDRQRHTAVALSLSMAAIEALLCRKGADIANQISENVATLFEPEARSRADAVRFVKDLYDARSRTLHGERVEQEAQKRRHARLLASAVLKALFERWEFQLKMYGEIETPDELLDELRSSKYGDGEIPGVGVSPVRKLWKDATV